MNVQAHVSGQLSSQVPNQTEIQLPVLPQQNGAPSSSQAQQIGRQPELNKIRSFMLRKICEILLRRHQPTHEIQAKKIKDIVRRLEDGLFRGASSQEEYMNLDTLESRLHVMIKRQSPHNRRFAQQQNVSSIGTMIPTPGLSNGGKPNKRTVQQGDTSMMPADGNNSMKSSSMKIESSTATATASMASSALQNGSVTPSEGRKSEEYDGRNTMISDMGVQKGPSRMMPTPGFTSSDNHSSLKIETTNVSHGFSTADAAMLPQQQQLKQHAGSQNSRMLHTPGIQVGKQPKQHVFSNGFMGGGSSDGYLNDASLGILSKPFRQHSDHSQQSLQHGTYKPKLNFLTNQSDLHESQQNEDKKPQSSDHLETINLPVLRQDNSHPPHEQFVQELSHRIARQDDAQCNDLSPDPSTVSQTMMSRITGELVPSGLATCSSVNASREKSFVNQKTWILFLKHAQHCTAPEGRCRDSNCPTAQKLLKHVDQCRIVNCPYPRCHKTKILLGHYKTCKDQGCPVCVPVKSFLSNHRKLVKLSRLPKAEDSSAVLSPKGVSTDSSDDFSPALKRIKIEDSSQTEILGHGQSTLSSGPVSESGNVQALQFDGYDHGDVCLHIKCESVDAKREHHSNNGQDNPLLNEVATVDNDALYNRQSTRPVLFDEASKFVNQETIKAEIEIVQSKQEIASPVEGVTKSSKPKIKGVSLIELFTPEQVLQHITGLRQWIGQSKAKAEKNQAMEHFMSENSCQLCAVERLTFEPPPIYCTPCGARIKRNAAYYTFGVGDTRNYFCVHCYNDARGDVIGVDGNIVRKSRLEKKKNDEETEEWWVQCDKCESWQHQICALFNGKRNVAGQAEYTCPQCYVDEIDRGERQPLPPSAVLGAKDLPRTILSDHIEERLNKRLYWERQERARVQGKGYNEVPGAEALVVRVVSSVDKKLEVKQRFLEIFQRDNYPREFPYKSKVVLLFQKIEGVEVCLFGMYVQEFGAEYQNPNQRRVYLSYLDSVKYFRPEINAVTGEALRTFVYHEILIGYLEYCKKRGFTSCYMWACPPLKGEDYILYCHPEIQKTPKSDKLREWYLSMLKKATEESIVVGLTNLYDHFFSSTGECKFKVTAARLPYFDGDYWPGAAEDMICQIQQEEDDRKLSKKGSTKKTSAKRALKESGQLDLSSNESMDQLLMHKLGETISPMKEDFIMVHLQHACTHCCALMVSGSRWVCGQCKDFQLCDKCYGAEQIRGDRERHPVHHKEKHNIYQVEIIDVPVDTKDKDEILESEFFDTRQAFLSLCQGNHYQYDTLRRAKHSSMMILYHLHNPTAPAYVSTCNVCFTDIDVGQGWRCEVCPDYDVCNSCYQKGVDHPHKMTNHPSNVEPNKQNQEARQQRVLQLRKMLDLLVHASQCRLPSCQYPNCRKVKGLFRHGITCKTRASGGCGVCKKMWYLLQLHARACKESECHVPRCRDLKIHTRRLQQQSDSRRRAAVIEMMRQRAAEVAGNS